MGLNIPVGKHTFDMWAWLEEMRRKRTAGGEGLKGI